MTRIRFDSDTGVSYCEGTVFDAAKRTDIYQGSRGDTVLLGATIGTAQKKPAHTGDNVRYGSKADVVT